MKKLILVLALLAAPVARADKLVLHGYGEGAIGASVPVSDDAYKKFAQATFKFSLRGGLELWLFKKFGFAPELQIDLFPIKTNDGTYRAVVNGTTVGVDTPFGRYRVLFGGRFIFDFGIGSAFARFLIGADYINGDESGTLFGVTVRSSFSSTAFTLQPGVGVNFRFLKYMTAGLSLDLPVAFHDVGRNDAAGIQKFDAIDIDILGTVGFRI